MISVLNQKLSFIPLFQSVLHLYILTFIFNISFQLYYCKWSFKLYCRGFHILVIKFTGPWLLAANSLC